MENQNTPESITKTSSKKTWQSWFTMRRAIPICALLILLSIFYYYRAAFVAATVNGSPISRLSVIKELEKQGGKQALDTIINQKLIEAELKKQKVSVPQAEIDEEIKRIETQVASQGGTLEMALAQQGVTEEKLREQIILQKKLEKLLENKTSVTEGEIDAYIKTLKTAPPKEMKMEDFRDAVKDQLHQQKFQQEAQKWVSELTSSAKIKYFVSY